MTVIALLALGWAALLAVVPLLATGAVGAGGRQVAGFVRVAAGRVCHQRVERSLAWHGRPFPVCGRCLALYVGGAAGLTLVAAWAWRRRDLRVGRPVRPLWPATRLTAEATWLLAAAAPAGLVAVIEWTAADPGTWARAIGSLPLGLAAGVVCGIGLARTRRPQPGLLH